MRNRDSSSDDEEDREHLIEQNHRKSHQAPSSPQRSISTFQIDDVTTQIRRRFANLGRKRLYLYLLLIFLPLFIIILFFTTDIRDLFSYNLNITRDTLSDHMRESELRALYLLKQQRSFLLSMFDSSNTNFSTSDFKSSLIKQISLNKEIQQVLLSPHKALNESTDGFGDVDLDMPKCSRLDRRQSDRKTVEWKPDSGKFLFAVCLSGQMSNHLICLEKHMFFAALLNRVLVIPSPKFDYQYDRVIDIKRINDCLGRKVVIEFDEFVEMKKNHPRIDKFICYFSLPTMCYLDEEHVKRLKGLGISMGSKLDSPWKEDVKSPSKQSVDDFLSKFGSTDDVIAIGDVFFADLEQEWVMQPGGPIAHKCKTLIEPSRLIMLTAQRFIQTFLGNNFVALHFRRHGFLKFCNIKNPSCFYPVPQSAECIARVVESVNAPVIYLSTDAAESETGLLQSLVIVNGKTVPLVKRPSHTSVEKWDALLYRHGLGEDSQAEAMLDKTICAMSSVFIGASGSTFTEDILRLRKDWLTASSCDEYLCQGELPNFIAENE